MPKIKTHSGAKKRFKKTASGKLKYRKPGRSHNTGLNKEKRMRGLRQAAYIFEGMARRIGRLLPNW
ncbi:50S ribosomal protein L35 [bacterium]|nr:50S ribosomal protein L35 [bacterium]